MPEAATATTTSVVRRAAGPIISALAGRRVVLGTLDRADHRGLAAGQQIDQPLVGPAEGRVQLDAVLDREPARSAGADIDQAPTLAQPGGGGLRPRRVSAGQRIAHRDECRLLVVEHRRQQLLGRPAIGIAVAGEPALGVHGASDLLAAIDTSKIPLGKRNIHPAQQEPVNKRFC